MAERELDRRTLRHLRIAVAVVLIAGLALVGVTIGRGEGPPVAEGPTGGAPATTASTSTTIPASVEPEPRPEPTTTTAAPVLASFAGLNPRVVRSPSGVVLPVRGRTASDAVLVGLPCGDQGELRSGSVVEAEVVLDPGHGGDEPGAVGPRGLREKDLNLAVSEATRDFLAAQGVGAVLTRTSDYRMTLAARAEVVQAAQPRAFVSVHFNAEPDEPWPGPGSETYYQTVGPTAAESRRLAGVVYEDVVAGLSRYQGVAWVADTDAGAKYRKNSAGDDYYGIVRRTQGAPGILAELGFISNAPEEELYRRPEVQRAVGEALARGIVRFLRTQDPGSGFTEPYPRVSPAGPGGGGRGCQNPPLA